MLEGFISLITSRLAGPILGSLLVASLIGNAYQAIHDHIVISGLHTDLSKVTKERDGLLVDNAILKGNQATLKAAIATQNTAVDGLKSAADLSAAQAKATQAGFNALADAKDKRAAAIAKLPPLPAGADRCAAASQLIRNHLASERNQ
jgi:hypothetical protein